MELTRECIEEIVLAAREVDNGKLVITVQSRPEDSRSFDLKCEFEKRCRVSRDGRKAVPTETDAKKYPQDKFS
jgi:hypothetical protein